MLADYPGECRLCVASPLVKSLSPGIVDTDTVLDLCQERAPKLKELQDLRGRWANECLRTMFADQHNASKGRVSTFCKGYGLNTLVAYRAQWEWEEASREEVQNHLDGHSVNEAGSDFLAVRALGFRNADKAVVSCLVKAVMPWLWPKSTALGYLQRCHVTARAVDLAAVALTEIHEDLVELAPQTNLVCQMLSFVSDYNRWCTQDVMKLLVLSVMRDSGVQVDWHKTKPSMGQAEALVQPPFFPKVDRVVPIDAIADRARRRYRALFGNIWNTFADPAATSVKERMQQVLFHRDVVHSYEEDTRHAREVFKKGAEDSIPRSVDFQSLDAYDIKPAPEEDPMGSRVFLCSSSVSRDFEALVPDGEYMIGKYCEQDVYVYDSRELSRAAKESHAVAKTIYIEEDAILLALSSGRADNILSWKVKDLIEGLYRVAGAKLIAHITRRVISAIRGRPVKVVKAILQTFMKPDMFVGRLSVPGIVLWLSRLCKGCNVNQAEFELECFEVKCSVYFTVQRPELMIFNVCCSAAAGLMDAFEDNGNLREAGVRNFNSLVQMMGPVEFRNSAIDNPSGVGNFYYARRMAHIVAQQGAKVLVGTRLILSGVELRTMIENVVSGIVSSSSPRVLGGDDVKGGALAARRSKCVLTDRVEFTSETMKPRDRRSFGEAAPSALKTGGCVTGSVVLHSVKSARVACPSYNGSDPFIALGHGRPEDIAADVSTLVGYRRVPTGKPGEFFLGGRKLYCAASDRVNMWHLSSTATLADDGVAHSRNRRNYLGLKDAVTEEGTPSVDL